MKCGIHGVDGKMGQVITRLALDNPALSVGSAYSRAGHPWSGKSLREFFGESADNVRIGSHLETFCRGCDVVIDYTRPEATLELLPVCRKLGKPLLIGTTGFSDEAKRWIDEAARDIPIILAANTSIGVNVLIEVTKQVAKALPKDTWHADILELHHEHKVDAPSGTALRLGEAVAEGQGDTLSDRRVYPYDKARGDDDIGFAVLRMGEVVGEHTVYFTSADERIELTHRAHDRRIFAQGALRAAAWLHNKPAGRYTMADVLGFSV